MAIQSFADRRTEAFFESGRVPRRTPWSQLKKVVRRKLDILHYAHRLEDLKAPPGNRLEALKGELSGYHSIRVNDQWRIVFRWTPQGPEQVRISDYHRG